MIEKLREMVDNDLNRLKNLGKKLNQVQAFAGQKRFASALKLLDTIASDMNSFFPRSLTLLEKYRENLNNDYREFRLNFDSELAEKFKEKGLTSIAGNSRAGFKVKGIIEIRIDFDRAISIIGTSCKSFKIESIQIEDILKQVLLTQNRLFERTFDSFKFVEELFNAYVEVSQNKTEIEVLLREVQKRIWTARQKESFWMTFDKDRLVEYPTDEFSVDLSMLLKNKDLTTTEGYRFMLSEGSNGIVVHDNMGNFKSFKFLLFKK
jgi:hypothetical protein